MTAEQQARDMLERMGIEDAQRLTAGDLVELANMVADLAEQCRLLGMGSEREARLMAQLAESQAREAILRKGLELCKFDSLNMRISEWEEVRRAYCITPDDSALREMIAQALDEVADEEPINGNELAQVRVRMKATAIRARKG